MQSSLIPPQNEPSFLTKTKLRDQVDLQEASPGLANSTDSAMEFLSKADTLLPSLSNDVELEPTYPSTSRRVQPKTPSTTDLARTAMEELMEEGAIMCDEFARRSIELHREKMGGESA